MNIYMVLVAFAVGSGDMKTTVDYQRLYRLLMRCNVINSIKRLSAFSERRHDEISLHKLTLFSLCVY